MKHLRNQSTLAMFLLAFAMFLLTLLLSAPAWAVQPEPGCYEKKDANGNVTARMYVTAMNGKGEMAAAAKELCITLEALDANGTVTEQLVSDYLESPVYANGAGLDGFRLTGESLRNSQTASENFPRFYPERFSIMWGQHIEFSCPGDHRVSVHNCGANLDGSYVLNSSKECYITLPALLFAYEKTYCPKQYDYKHEPAGYYALGRDLKESNYPTGIDYVLRVSNPPTDEHWNLIADHQMHIVMENRQNDYHFPFVRDNYASEWIDSAWRDFAGYDLLYVSMLYLHQYITRNAPELLENPAAFFRVTDTHKGKGDIVTWKVAILLPDNNGETKLGSALVTNHAVVRLAKGDEPLNVKKKKAKEKKEKVKNKK